MTSILPTQILIFHIAEAQRLVEHDYEGYGLWQDALATIEKSNNVQEIRWGIGVERYWEASIHVVRPSLEAHKDYLESDVHLEVLSLLSVLSKEPPVIRHVDMKTFTEGRSPFDAPVTGTAIYLDCKPDLWDPAWRAWTQIVPGVDGCWGVAGGYMRETDQGRGTAYLVYVGWESIAKHDTFHHTDLFKRRRVLLGTGNSGYAEYGHVRFMEQRHMKPSTKL